VSRPVLLVLRPLGLGDLLTALPALRALAEAFADHHRVLATTPELAPLAMLTGTVHEVLAARPLGPLAGPQTPDVAVNLHGRGPQSHRVLLALAPRRLIAFEHAVVPDSRGLPVWRPDEHEVRRWCRLLDECGVPADPARLDLPAPPEPAPAEARGATVIHPGAASPARCWPAARWIRVARAELAAGRRIVLTGGPGEEALAREIARRAEVPGQSVWAGRTDVVSLARLVAAAGRVVCADTGVAHLATALRTPSVVLFGPTPPALWGPPSDRPWHRVLWAGATGSAHGPHADPGLLRISVEDVLEALASLPPAPAVEVLT
jgi:ADP-heptose:LPS heptosyltransferase